MVKAVADGVNSKAMHRIAMVDTKLRAMVFDFKVGIVPTFFVLTFSPLSPTSPRDSSRPETDDDH